MIAYERLLLASGANALSRPRTPNLASDSRLGVGTRVAGRWRSDCHHRFNRQPPAWGRFRRAGNGRIGEQLPVLQDGVIVMTSDRQGVFVLGKRKT